jgi:hypothetical protein
VDDPSAMGLREPSLHGKRLSLVDSFVKIRLPKADGTRSLVVVRTQGTDAKMLPAPNMGIDLTARIFANVEPP